MILLAFLICFPTDSLFAADRVYLFAEHLYEQGDYKGALAEFRRYVFLADPPAGDVPEKIIRCLVAMERYDEAREECGRLEPGPRDLLTGWIYFLSGNYDSTRAVLGRTGPPYAGDKKKLFGLSYAEEYDIKNAGAYLDLPRPAPKYRSLWLGAGFSLIPGGGHFYAGKFDDGIYSMVIVGTASLLAYYYHGRQEGLKFGLSLSAAALFYAGSIYGGLNACQNQNRYLNERYLERVREENSINGQ
jgi:tetratricopeptide (TPR) repeat protein